MPATCKRWQPIEDSLHRCPKPGLTLTWSSSEALVQLPALPEASCWSPGDRTLWPSASSWRWGRWHSVTRNRKPQAWYAMRQQGHYRWPTSPWQKPPKHNAVSLFMQLRAAKRSLAPGLHAQRLSQHGAGLAPLLRPLRPRRASPWVPGPAPAPRQGRGDTGRTGGRISVSSAWDLRVNLPPFILQSVNTQHPGDVAEYFWITEGYRGLQAGAGGTAMLGPPSPAQPRPLQGCLPSGVTGLEAARRLQPSLSGPVCVVLIVLIWKPVDKHTSSKNPVFSLKLWKPTQTIKFPFWERFCLLALPVWQEDPGHRLLSRAAAMHFCLAPCTAWAVVSLQPRCPTQAQELCCGPAGLVLSPSFSSQGPTDKHWLSG